MNSMENEILPFIRTIFHNCDMKAQYYPESAAWHFMLTFPTFCDTYAIKPPRGCCIMSVQAVAGQVSFQMVLFVADYVSYHLQPAYN